VPRPTQVKDIASPRLAVADRDLPPWLDQVELGELAGAIDRALIGPLRAEDRAQLAQIVIEDRL